MKSIVLLSSGLDSTVAFKEAYSTCDETLCVTFDYGQRARKREIEYAKNICEKFQVGHIIIQLPWYSAFRGALTGGDELPKISTSELDDENITRKTAQQVWVPARNVVFLGIAAAIAENYNYDIIVAGFDAEEAVTFPDNTLEFVKRFNDMLKFGTLTHPTIHTPFVYMDKVGIVRKGIEIDAPLEWSWSCYEGGEKPCMVCESCLRRKRAFDSVGVKDPLLVRLGI